jgi:CBS domain-containing protein
MKPINSAGTIRIADLMTGPAPVVPSRLAMSAARKVAALKSVPWLLVEESGRLTGLLDAGALSAGRDEDPVSAHMTALTAAVTPQTTVARAHALLVKTRLAWLPVLAGIFVVGTASREVLDRAMARTSRHAARAARMEE